MTDTPAQAPIAWRYRLKGAKQPWIYDDTIKNADDPRVVDKTYYEVEPLYAAAPAQSSAVERWREQSPALVAALVDEPAQSAPISSPFDDMAKAVIERIKQGYDKLASSPLGMASAWERKASGGKPLLYGGARGLLAYGTIATWDEFDLIVDVVNNLPTILLALSQSRTPAETVSQYDLTTHIQESCQLGTCDAEMIAKAIQLDFDVRRKPTVPSTERRDV
jgi:hypothetical protein